MTQADTLGKPADPRDRALEYEVLEEDSGMRLDHFLNDRMVWRSRSSIQKLISKGKVRVRDNEHTLPEKSQPAKKASRRVKPGEIYSANIPVPRRETESLAAIPDLEIPILYEDKWLLAVDKPAGIPVHPGGRLLDRTVITMLNERYTQRGGRAGAGTSKSSNPDAGANKPDGEDENANKPTGPTANANIPTCPATSANIPTSTAANANIPTSPAANANKSTSTAASKTAPPPSPLKLCHRPGPGNLGRAPHLQGRHLHAVLHAPVRGAQGDQGIPGPRPWRAERRPG